MLVVVVVASGPSGLRALSAIFRVRDAFFLPLRGIVAWSLKDKAHLKLEAGRVNSKDDR